MSRAASRQVDPPISTGRNRLRLERTGWRDDHGECGLGAGVGLALRLAAQAGELISGEHDDVRDARSFTTPHDLRGVREVGRGAGDPDVTRHPQLRRYRALILRKISHCPVQRLPRVSHFRFDRFSIVINLTF